MLNDELRNKVLERIRRGEVVMRPRVYFVVQVAALSLVVLVALAVTIFLLNFILFSIRLNHQDQLLVMGLAGWGAFLQFFPWLWLALDVALVFVLQWMLRTFRWGWRIPTLYLFAGLFALSLAGGFLLDRATPFNDDLFEMRHDLPPPWRGFYEGARRPDIDDTLQSFGIPLPPDQDDR